LPRDKKDRARWIIVRQISSMAGHSVKGAGQRPTPQSVHSIRKFSL
jgi:hypothetical protein